MATIEELLQAAANADAAGDSAAAQMLVREAEKFMGTATAAKPAYREGVDGPITPPRGEDAFTPTPERPDRFGDTIADTMEGPIAGVKAFGRGLMDQSQSPTMQALPEGFPAPLKRPVAAAGDLAMTGLSALGAGLAGGAGLVAEVAGGSPTNERKMARDLMMGLQVAVPELAGVSGTVRAGGAAARAAETAGAAPTAKQAAARAADDLGITPSLGMTGRTGATAAAGFEKVPLAGNAIAADAARAVAEVEGVFNRIKSGVGRSVSPAAAGDRLQSGLVKAVETFKSRANSLFSKVDARIDQNARFPVPNSARVVREVKEPFAQNPELAKKLGLNSWDGIIAEAEKNGVTWQALRQFRTSVGEALGSPRGSLADEDIGRLKGLYAALTQDMESAAQSAGNGAFGAWKAATNYYKSGANKIERSLDATISAKSPERAFEAFSALLKKDRSTADIARVRDIKSAMPKEDWADVSASIVERLGKASSGQQNAAGDVFSTSKFLTEWNNMTPEAKRLLLPEDARIELEKLATVAERVKAANLERNFSNTGTALGWVATIFGASADPMMAAGAIGGATIGAKAVTSTAFLSALNRAARGDSKAIAAMARGNGPFKADAATVLRLMAANTATQPNEGPSLRAVSP